MLMPKNTWKELKFIINLMIYGEACASSFHFAEFINTFMKVGFKVKKPERRKSHGLN